MEDRMEQEQITVVGVFDDYATTQQAAREMENDGVPRSQIQVESNMKTGAAGYGGVETEEHHEGGIRGFFHRLFGGDDGEHGHYQEALRRGNSIVAVTAGPEQIDRIARIMNDLGAIDIDRRANYYRQTGYSEYNENSPAYTSEEARLDRERFREQASGTAIPVIEEQLQVGKRAVRRGGVRVYSHVIDQPVEEQIKLREERIRVDRRPANRPVESGDLSRLQDQTIEVTETVEEPVVSKRAIVREEVVAGKETTERTETIRDNVRRTEVRVEPIAGSGMGTAAELEISPGYSYGSRMARDPRFQGQSWDEAENDLRVDYMRNNSTSRWDEVKAEIRRGWDKVTGRR
jgi:uncharacterized protein (TIGR02271 family)